MGFDIAPYIDHTILKPVATTQDILQLCTEAKEASFAAVCVPPYYVAFAKTQLESSTVKLATIVGFPFGYSSTASKLAEISDALEAGADEIDLVHNIAALKNGDIAFTQEEVRRCTEAVHKAGKTIKIIIESGVLTDNEIVICCELYSVAGIDLMKTSTGYAETGATMHAVQLMRKHLPADIGIKASGGIRTFAFAKELIDAGADRIGCSASIEILKQSKA